MSEFKDEKKALDCTSKLCSLMIEQFTQCNEFIYFFIFTHIIIIIKLLGAF